MKTRNDIDAMIPNQLVSWFLMGCYAYYTLSSPIMTDTDFDHMVEKLKEQWDNADHPHKELISKTHLDATTGYDIKFPNITKYSTQDYVMNGE